MNPQRLIDFALAVGIIAALWSLGQFMAYELSRLAA